MSETKEVIVKKKPQHKNNNSNNNNNRNNRRNNKPITVSQQGGKLTFSRPVREIKGLGKYTEGETEISRTRRKKKLYKQKLKEAQTNPWWKDLLSGIPDILKTVAPTLISAISGFGDYQVNANSMLAAATNLDNGSAIPMMCNSKVANVIRHREFIANVIGSTTEFSAKTYSINPGLDETFPWLNLVAQGFTSYRMLGMIMEYVSLASDYTTNTYLGYVAMGTQYNSLEPVFADKLSLENSEYANSKKPSISFEHPIECAPNQMVLTQLYLRSGSLPANADLKFYDLGRFTIATGGQTSNGIIGELWATFEVEFYQPRLPKTLSNHINADHWYNNAGTASGTDPFGTIGTQNQAPGTTMPGSTLSNVMYTFPKEVSSGYYKVTYIDQGGPTTITAPSITLANCAFENRIRFGAAFLSSPQNGAILVESFSYIFYLRITGSSAQFSFSVAGGNPIPGTGNIDLYISNIPASVVLEDIEENNKLKIRGYGDKIMAAERQKENYRKSLLDKDFNDKIEYTIRRKVIDQLIEDFPTKRKIQIITLCEIYQFNYLEIKRLLQDDLHEDSINMNKQSDLEFPTGSPVNISELINIVMSQTFCSKELANNLLKHNNYDVIKTITKYNGM